MNNHLTPPRPLGLSTEQLELLIDKASYIAPEWRSRFLANVVDLLLPKDSVTNAEVEHACITISNRMRAKGRKGNEPELRRA